MKILPNHHAIFSSGDIGMSMEFFKEGLKERGIEVMGNPDVLFLHHDNFGIDESRELYQISLSAPLQEDKKIIALSFKKISREAENALLKLFEDPNPRSEFLIASSNFDSLLPTLRSRLFLINREGEKSKNESGIKKFLALPIGEKLKETDKIQKAYKDSEGDKGVIRDFLLALHSELEKEPVKNADALRASARSLSYIDDPSSSIKILLESVVLAL